MNYNSMSRVSIPLPLTFTLVGHPVVSVRTVLKGPPSALAFHSARLIFHFNLNLLASPFALRSCEERFIPSSMGKSKSESESEIEPEQVYIHSPYAVYVIRGAERRKKTLKVERGEHNTQHETQHTQHWTLNTHTQEKRKDEDWGVDCIKEGREEEDEGPNLESKSKTIPNRKEYLLVPRGNLFRKKENVRWT